VTIDIESLQNRLLKVCYVPATNASLPRGKLLLFFSFFVAADIDSTNEANKVTLAVYILRCLWLWPHYLGADIAEGLRVEAKEFVALEKQIDFQ
jgi:hypothetical protein